MELKIAPFGQKMWDSAHTLRFPIKWQKLEYFCMQKYLLIRPVSITLIRAGVAVQRASCYPIKDMDLSSICFKSQERRFSALGARKSIFPIYWRKNPKPGHWLTCTNHENNRFDFHSQWFPSTRRSKKYLTGCSGQQKWKVKFWLCCPLWAKWNWIWRQRGCYGGACNFWGKLNYQQ